MRWMLSVWVAAALLALCRGYSTGFEGYRLSMSGYRLCTRNETRLVSVLVTHRIPYTVTRPCGGWLLWKTCEVTLYRTTHQTEYKTVTQEVTRCCDGYVQVGSYCALPLNRSREFTARPGSCSSADGLPPSYEDCEWDIDCPGCQKCCQKSSISLCTDAASSAYYSENGGWRFNVTVTVKTDYQQLMSMDRGLLNHTRVLHAMVTGALDSPNVSVQYLSSGPVHPFRTATSLLIDSDFPLSLSNATSKLHLLLKHIGEVSSVTVEDVDECAHTGLRKCSPQAECNNTVGSYLCTCRQGYIDVDPSNTGAHCQADPRGTTTTEPPAPCNMVTMPTSTSPPPMNTTRTPTTNTTQHPATGNSTMGIFNSSETSMPTVLNTTSSGHSYSSYAPQLQTSAAPYTSMGSTVDVQTTTCAPPHLTSLQSANVTGNSFCAYWSCQFQTNQTYLVVLSQGSEVIRAWETNQTMSEVTGLQPGVLYNVTVTPCACGRQGDALQMSVKTAAQTLDATARLTNVQFTADLLNSSSQAYLNLTQSIKQEIYQSLSSEIKAMVASGQVRIKINSLSQGSVVVNFTIISTPNNDVNQPINNVSSALLSSLKNSSKYTVDENSTSINDFDECASGENDCSQWATCTNIWASYECICMEGFTDNNPARPGRACQAMGTTTSFETAAQSVTTTMFSTVRTSTPPPITSSSNAIAATTATNSPDTTTGITLTSGVVATTVISQPSTPVSTTAMMSAPSAITTQAASAVPVVTTAPTTTITATTATTSTTTTTTTTPTTTTTTTSTTPTTTTTTTTTAPTTTTTTPATSTSPTTTTTAPTTIATAPSITTTTPATTTSPTTTTTPTTTTSTPTTTTTTTAPTTTTTAPTTTTTAPTTTTTATAPTTTTTAPTTTTTATTTTTTTPTTTTATRTTTTTAITTTTTTPTTTTTAPTTTITATTTITTTPTTTTTTPTTTTTAPTTTTTSPTTTTTAPTTIATAPSITTTTPATTTSPTTTTSAPTTTTTAPSATTTTSATTSTAPTTTTTTPTTTTAPTTTTIAPTTTTIAPATTSTTSEVTPGTISVRCRAIAITVTVARDFLVSKQISDDALYLGLEECGINGGNATHAQLTVAWDECDTKLLHNETYYTAQVTLFNTMDPHRLPNGIVEVPKIQLQVPIMCTYRKSILISTGFGSMGYEMIKDTIMGSGSFHVTVKLMNGTAPLPQNYSLSPEDDVVVEVSLNTSAQQIKVVINKCWATPSINPTASDSYTFLEYSCPLPNTHTTVLQNGNSSTSRLSVRIFSFVNLDVIYLHCQVQICVQMGSATCVPDCTERTARLSNTIGRAYGFSGPLLRSDYESLEEGFDTLHLVGFCCLGVGLALLFLGGFICLFYCQRNRIGHYNFSLKPKEENFTYLVFNT